MPKKEIWLDRVYQQGRAKAADEAKPVAKRRKFIH